MEPEAPPRDSPRVAFLPDTYHEVNGVALTARQLTAFAKRHNRPFYSLRPGDATRSWREGSVTMSEIKRSLLSMKVEADLWQDFLILKHRGRIRRELQEFKPDLIHCTSMGDFGFLALALSRDLDVPLVASWHTNVHQYGAWRAENTLKWLPKPIVRVVAAQAERRILRFSLWFYGKAAIAFAPNTELLDLVQSGTHKPAFLMERGSDTILFDPAKRTRSDGNFVFGFVGRLSAEKNVRFLKQVEQALVAKGHTDYCFLIVGHGGETEWLKSNLERADVPGVLKGEPLAEAYANMDVFVFPSYTDTYGNVITEAHASGVPTVVTNGGGPKYLVRHDETGLISQSDDEFITNCVALYEDRERHRRMCREARQEALRKSWDAVFERLYRNYQTALAS